MKAIAIACLSICLLAISYSLSAPAYAMTLNFEDLKSSCDAGGDLHIYRVQDGYGGLKWSNFYAMDSPEYNSYSGWQQSGYANGLVSGSVVLFNYAGDPATMLTSSAPMTLHSVYLTGAWDDQLSVRADAYLHGVLVGSKSVSVSAYHPTPVSYEFSNVDRVVWTASYGHNAGFGGFGTYLVMDDLSYDLVPEPSSTLALLCGIGGMGGIMLKRRPV